MPPRPASADDADPDQRQPGDEELREPHDGDHHRHAEIRLHDQQPGHERRTSTMAMMLPGKRGSARFAANSQAEITAKSA